MQYQNLPKVGSLTLPRLDHVMTGNSSPRYGAPRQKLWNHRWAGGSYPGVLQWFRNPNSDASAHFVYAGEIGHYKSKCAQMVTISRKAWTEAFYNRTGISIEAADAIWLGHDPVGFARLARINAFLLRQQKLPPNWVHGWTFGRKGFLRHADGGQLAGGHTQCPTTDLELWKQFVGRVKGEYQFGHFREHWEVI